MDSVKFTIPLQPVSKKNSQQILLNKRTGRPFIMPSKQYRAYQQKAAAFIPAGVNINTTVNIKYEFYMQTKRKCDLTNLEEAADDLLVHCGLLEDDNFTIVQGHDGSRVLYDKENPRTEVTITNL